MRFSKAAVPLALSCTLIGTLAACGDSSSTEAEGSRPTVTQTTKKPRPSETKTKRHPNPTHRAEGSAPKDTDPEPSREPEKACGDLSARQALNQNVGKVKEFRSGNPWDTEHAGVGLYDPCADLSPIVIGVVGATGSSPNHIMLFHKGEYLGTATAEPQNFVPGVEQVDSQTIAVTYHYTKPGEPNALRSGETHATFTWDPAQQKVVMSGDLPPQG